MNLTNRKSIRGVFFVCSFLFLVILCSASTSASSGQLNEGLTISIQPELYVNKYSGVAGDCNEKDRVCAELIYSIASNLELGSAKVEIILPEGLILKGGSLKWSGTVNKTQPLHLGVIVEAVEDGTWDIGAFLVEEEMGVYARTLLPITIENGSIFVSEVDEDVDERVGDEPLDLSFAVSPSSIRNKDKSVGEDITTTITGRWFYYSKEYEINKPIKNAVIELWDEDSGDDDLILTSSTDSEGRFSFTIHNVDEDENGRLDVYLKIKADSSLGAAYVVKSNNDIYFKKTETVNNIRHGSYSFDDIIIPESVVGASFHILDVITDGYLFVNTLGVEEPPKKIKVKFASSVSNTAYMDSLIRIKKDSRGYQWLSSLILHEYGHYIMDIYAGIDYSFFSYCHDKGEVSPNCKHGFFTQEDAGAAWVEGWAYMFGTAVRCESGYDRCSVFIMPLKSGNSVSYLNIDMETLTNLLITAYNDGVISKPDTVEASVAAILYDIYDSNDELSIIPNAADALSLGFDEIWDITVNYDPPGSATFPRTIHDFWDGWLSIYGQRMELNEIFWANQVDKNEGPTIELLNRKDLVFTNGELDFSVIASDFDGHVSYVYAELKGKINAGDEWKTITIKTGYLIDPMYEETFKNIGYEYVVKPLDSGDLWEFSVSIPPLEYSSLEVGVNVYSVDNLGNSTKCYLGDDEYSIVVFVDRELPNAEITAPSRADYGDVYLRLKYGDDLSGVDSCRYRNNDELWSDWEPCLERKSWELSAYGENKVYYQVRDKAGNIQEDSTVVTFSPVNLVCAGGSDGDEGDPGAYGSIQSSTACEYTSIQEAIDDADEFDVILVEPGIYNEAQGITIDKKGIRLKGLRINGEMPVIYARGNHAITINKDGVVVEGLEIRGSSGTGIFIKSNGNTIDNCLVSENGYGIVLFRGESNVIKNSEIRDNKYIGLYSYFSRRSSFMTDSVHGNGYYGIFMYGSDKNIFSNCKILDNKYYGVVLYYSDNNEFYMSTISQGYYCGTLQYRCTGNTFSGTSGGVCTI